MTHWSIALAILNYKPFRLKEGRYAALLFFCIDFGKRDAIMVDMKNQRKIFRCFRRRAMPLRFMLYILRISKMGFIVG